MCFSATASFTAAAALIPAGIYCLSKSRSTDQPYWALMLIPLAFGIQQAFEGGLWLALEQGKHDEAELYTLAFMFFSHWFWLAWVPFSCYLMETRPQVKLLLQILTSYGFLYGGFLYIPVVIFDDWVKVFIENHSIVYSVRLLYDEEIPMNLVRVAYASAILIPLLIVEDRHYRKFGLLIAASVLPAAFYFPHSFISVWCYLSAILSLYILFVAVQLAAEHSARLSTESRN